MTISKSTFGRMPDGREVSLWTLRSGALSFSLTNYGAAWTSLVVPSAHGSADVLLGFDTLDGWRGNTAFMNATIGRFSNRIAGAAFSLNGRRYALDANDGANCLHGGARAFHTALWQGEEVEERGGVFVRFSLRSPDGEGGFPGTLDAVVQYGLSAENVVSADYAATLDADCPLSFTNHAYFNLAGEGAGNVLRHELTLHAASYAPLDARQIPTGVLAPVAGTPFDFRRAKPVGEGMAGGYDLPFALDGDAGTLRPAASVFEPSSGRTLALSATQPALHFYSGNNIGEVRGKGAHVYRAHDGFCLETEGFPDSPNQEGFPSAIFGPARPYHEQARFEFNW